MKAGLKASPDLVAVARYRIATLLPFIDSYGTKPDWLQLPFSSVSTGDGTGPVPDTRVKVILTPLIPATRARPDTPSSLRTMETRPEALKRNCGLGELTFPGSATRPSAFAADRLWP